MAEIDTRIEGAAGRITLMRPDALNAATYDMLLAIGAALDAWKNNDTVKIVIIDALGDRAFCAGGDIADLYAAGRAGNFEFGRKFWRDEYRINAKIAEYSKPIVTFLQGFTMGGGVGLGCHASHRIVGDTSKIALPECSIGLVPDVGGSMILAKAPGRIGEYLGITATRLGPGDAIFTGFADAYIPEDEWPKVKAALVDLGDVGVIPSHPAPASAISTQVGEIEQLFSGTLPEIMARLDAAETPLAVTALKAMLRNSPLSMASALVLIDRVRKEATIKNALTQEYRFTWRASEDGDFLEGIRAAIIDKDRNPNWQHSPVSVTVEDAMAMMAPLGDNELTWEGSA